MTQYELDAVGKAMEKAMTIGAPGLSALARQAVIAHAVLQLRHQFNVPRPALAATKPDGD
jgi:hypothetical protein